jgi:hypothetical protein
MHFQGGAVLAEPGEEKAKKVELLRTSLAETASSLTSTEERL